MYGGGGGGGGGTLKWINDNHFDAAAADAEAVQPSYNSFYNTSTWALQPLYFVIVLWAKVHRLPHTY